MSETVTALQGELGRRHSRGAQDAIGKSASELRSSIAELERQYRDAEGTAKERIKSDLDYAKRELARVSGDAAGGANAISHPAPEAARRGEEAARKGITGGQASPLDAKPGRWGGLSSAAGNNRDVGAAMPTRMAWPGGSLDAEATATAASSGVPQGRWGGRASEKAGAILFAPTGRR